MEVAAPEQERGGRLMSADSTSGGYSDFKRRCGQSGSVDMESPINTKCDLCFSVYDSFSHVPKLLPCGHCFCLPCLRTMVLDSEVKCRCCKKYSHIPGGEVIDFPTNYALLSVSGNNCSDCCSAWSKTCPGCSDNLCECCLSLHEHNSQIKDVLNKLETVCEVLQTISEKVGLTIDKHNKVLEDRRLEIDKICDGFHKEIDQLQTTLKSNLSEIVQQNKNTKDSLQVHYKDELTKNEEYLAITKNLLSCGDHETRQDGLDYVQEECYIQMATVDLAKSALPMMLTCNLIVGSLSKCAELQVVQCKIPDLDIDDTPSSTRNKSAIPRPYGPGHIQPSPHVLREQLLSQMTAPPPVNIHPGLSRPTAAAVNQAMMMGMPYQQQYTNMAHYPPRYGVVPQGMMAPPPPQMFAYIAQHGGMPPRPLISQVPAANIQGAHTTGIQNMPPASAFSGRPLMLIPPPRAGTPTGPRVQLSDIQPEGVVPEATLPPVSRDDGTTSGKLGITPNSVADDVMKVGELVQVPDGPINDTIPITSTARDVSTTESTNPPDNNRASDSSDIGT